MDDLSVALAAFIFLTFLLAGLVKGVTGMGLPPVAMGLLVVSMPPHQAASLLLLPAFATNVWQFAAGPDPIGAARRHFPMTVMIALGAVATAGLLAGDSARHAIAGLGVVLALYALFGLAGKRISIPPAAEGWAGAPVGLMTGAITGATGVSSMPTVMYLQGLGLEKEDLVEALGLSFTVATIALGVGLWLADGLHAASLGGSALALIPAFLGMAAGQRLRAKISPDAFRLVFCVCLLGLGLYLIRGGG